MFFLFSGDEIFAVNGNLLQGLSHSEAIAIFKQIRSGPVVLQTGRRTQQQQQQIMVNILISRVFLDKNLGIYNIVPNL